jgi:hypothetical protein
MFVGFSVGQLSPEFIALHCTHTRFFAEQRICKATMQRIETGHEFCQVF